MSKNSLILSVYRLDSIVLNKIKCIKDTRTLFIYELKNPFNISTLGRETSYLRANDLRGNDPL